MTPMAILSLLAGVFAPSPAQRAEAALATFANAMAQTGPVNPTAGFPNWYRDQNGLTLDLMEAADARGISAPVVVGNAFSEQIGFGAEGFWWSADAIVPTAAGQAILVQAVEAAFSGGEIPTNGEQSAFGRVRIRVDVTDPGTYTITYPFGQKTYVIEPGSEGLRAINETIDIGCFAIPGLASCDPNSPLGSPNPGFNFAAATQSGIGPFLTWTTFDPNPTLTDPLLVDGVTGKRYVGSALAGPHAIKGSPTGNNLFRVEGPNIGGAGVNSVETNLFTVTGRLADTIAPVITITGDNPATVAKGAVYTDAGATALDNFDGDVTANIQATGLPVDTSVSGANTVTYSVTDASLNTATATRTVNVVNDPPVANADAFTTAEDVSRGITAAQLLANDTDPNAGDALSVTAVSAPVNGTVVLVGNDITFTPAANFNGLAFFQYTIADLDGATASSNVTITVSPGAAVGPQVVNDAAATTEDTAVTIPAADVLANDVEPNGNLPLAVTSVQGATNGTVSLAGTDIIFTPNLNFVGQASFTYTVSNSVAQTANGTVNVTVSPIGATPPVLTDDAATTDEDVPVTVNVLANDNNAANHLPLSVTAVGAAAHGTVTFTANDVTYAPSLNFNGSDSFTYTATDQIGQTSVATVNVTINPVADPVPTVSGVTITGLTNAGATITWTASSPSVGRVFFDQNKNKMTRALQATRRTIATSADGVNYTAVITGLQANKRYFFQVTATADQASVPTAIAEFRTVK